MTKPSRRRIAFELPGTFSTGCNYWASHAGTSMWSDWRPEVIREDFARLAATGMSVLRVFPLWPDFQPLRQLYGHGGREYELRVGDEPIPPSGPLSSGVSPVMLDRFSELCRIAGEYKLHLIVGLVTGWMSGRLFVPDALAGRDPITDPLSLTWQIRLVRTIVAHSVEQDASHASIVAWDLGNECNCMGRPTTREAAYVWTAAISSAIRSADPSRPVISGMHAVSSSIARIDGAPPVWTIEDQGELTDILTTHPYPYWVRHTRGDPVDAFRTTLHPTAECRFYSDIGGKPCIAEEIGTMGPMVASDAASARFARANLYSLWANDCRGMLWWCNHDQHRLAHPPYDWIGVELELGLFTADHRPKPIVHEFEAFRDFLKGLPFGALPPRQPEAVCILSRNIDDWSVAFGAFILAKQAQLELEFRTVLQELPESDTFLLPCITGPDAVPLRVWKELLRRVHAGATLYLSIDDGVVPFFNEVAGVEVVGRSRPTAPLRVAPVDGSHPALSVVTPERLLVENRTATVLAVSEADGRPVFWRHSHGAGQVIVFAAPLEHSLTTTSGSFDAGSPPAWRVYREIARAADRTRVMQHDHPFVATTEHVLPDGQRVIIAINHSSEIQKLHCALPRQVAVDRILRGEPRAAAPGIPAGLSIDIFPFDACVLLTRAAAEEPSPAFTARA